MIRTLQIIVSFMLIFPHFALAQSEERTFSRFRIRLNTGERIEGRGGRLTPTLLEGTSLQGQPINIAVSDIRLLDVSAGSQMLKGTLIGAAIGLLTSTTAVLLVEVHNKGHVDSGEAVALIGTFTSLGGAVGAGVGRFYPRWERVPLGSTSSFHLEFEMRKIVARVDF